MEEKYEDILKDTITELKKVLGKMEDNQRRDERIEELRTRLQENDEIENWNAFYQGEDILENDFNKEEAIEELKQLLENKNRQERELAVIRNSLNEVVKSKQEEVNRMDARIEELRTGLQGNDEIENWNRVLGEDELNDNFNKEEAIEELKQLLENREKIEKDRSNLEALTTLVSMNTIDKLYNIIQRYNELLVEDEKEREQEKSSVPIMIEEKEQIEQSMEENESEVNEDKKIEKIIVSDEDIMVPAQVNTMEDLNTDNVICANGRVYKGNEDMGSPTIEELEGLSQKSEEDIKGDTESVVSGQEKRRQEKLQQLYGIVVDMSKDYLDILDKYEYFHKYYAKAYANVSETSIENEIQRLKGKSIIDSIKDKILYDREHNEYGRLDGELEELVSLVEELETRKTELEKQATKQQEAKSQETVTPKVAKQETVKQTTKQTNPQIIVTKREENGKTISNISIGTEIIITYSDNTKELIKIRSAKKYFRMDLDEKLEKIDKLTGVCPKLKNETIIRNIDPMVMIALEKAKKVWDISSENIKQVLYNYIDSLSTGNNEEAKEATKSILTYDRRGFTNIWGRIMHGATYNAIIATSNRSEEFATIIEDENEDKIKARAEKKRAKKREAIPAPSEKLDKNEDKIKARAEKKRAKKRGLFSKKREAILDEELDEATKRLLDSYDDEEIYKEDDIHKRFEATDTVKQNIEGVSMRYSEEQTNMNVSTQGEQEYSQDDYERY